MNQVRLKGVVQEKSNKGAETARYFEKTEAKAAFLAFTLEVPDGNTRKEYIRCVARGVNADALKALIGSEVEFEGVLSSVKNAKSNQWNLQVSVTELLGQAGEAAVAIDNRAEIETKPLPKR
jgi:hypothetical protein